MYKVIIVIMIIISILLVASILMQNSKSDGMNSSLGAMGGNQLLGVKNTNSALEQITWGLAISLFSLAIVTTLLIKKEKSKGIYSANIERASEQVTIPTNVTSDHSNQEDRDNAPDTEDNITTKNESDI